MSGKVNSDNNSRSVAFRGVEKYVLILLRPISTRKTKADCVVFANGHMAVSTNAPFCHIVKLTTSGSFFSVGTDTTIVLLCMRDRIMTFFLDPDL